MSEDCGVDHRKKLTAEETSSEKTIEYTITQTLSLGTGLSVLVYLTLVLLIIALWKYILFS
jgi:hypothetical protein